MGRKGGRCKDGSRVTKADKKVGGRKGGEEAEGGGGWDERRGEGALFGGKALDSC